MTVFNLAKSWFDKTLLTQENIYPISKSNLDINSHTFIPLANSPRIKNILCLQHFLYSTKSDDIQEPKSFKKAILYNQAIE